MTRPNSPILTEGELRLMNILWEQGSATVKDITEVLAESEGLAYTTVLSTLQTLTKKGVVKPKKQGRAFVYYPLVKQKEARKSAIGYIKSRFFGGSAKSLVLNVLENEELDEDTLDRLKTLIAEKDSDNDS